MPRNRSRKQTERALEAQLEREANAERRRDQGNLNTDCHGLLLEGTPAVTRAAAARAPILMVARAAACVRASSRRKGRLLELGAGVP